MDIKVLEGPLVEVPAAGITGTFHAVAFDRRAWWMKHWIMGTLCLQTHEVFERLEPVLLVGHDADDGPWQLIGAADADDNGQVRHLHHAIDEDPTLIDVLDLEPGHSASRPHPEGPWTRHVGYPG